jgi:hypothetical protein
VDVCVCVCVVKDSAQHVASLLSVRHLSRMNAWAGNMWDALSRWMSHCFDVLCVSLLERSIRAE